LQSKNPISSKINHTTFKQGNHKGLPLPSAIYIVGAIPRASPVMVPRQKFSLPRKLLLKKDISALLY